MVVRAPLAVFDLDGTLADVRHRLPFLQQRPRDWDAFFRAAADDPPLVKGVALALETAERCELAYLTGRPEHCRTDSVQWLRQHGLPAGRLLMRARGTTAARAGSSSPNCCACWPGSARWPWWSTTTRAGGGRVPPGGLPGGPRRLDGGTGGTGGGAGARGAYLSPGVAPRSPDRGRSPRIGDRPALTALPRPRAGWRPAGRHIPTTEWTCIRTTASVNWAGGSASAGWPRRGSAASSTPATHSPPCCRSPSAWTTTGPCCCGHRPPPNWRVRSTRWWWRSRRTTSTSGRRPAGASSSSPGAPRWSPILSNRPGSGGTARAPGHPGPRGSSYASSPRWSPGANWQAARPRCAAPGPAPPPPG